MALQSIFSHDFQQLSQFSFIISFIVSNYVKISISLIVIIIAIDRYSFYLKTNKTRKRKPKSRKLPKAQPLIVFYAHKWKIFFLLICLAGVLMMSSGVRNEKIAGFFILAYGFMGFLSERAGIKLYDNALVVPRRYEFIPYFIVLGRVRIDAREIDYAGIKRNTLYGHTIVVQPYDRAAFSTIVISCLNDEESIRIIEFLLGPPLRLNTHRDEPSLYKY